MTNATYYLGRPIGELLNTKPFSEWRVVSSVENDPQLETWYEFEGRGVEVVCDGADQVHTVFLRRGDGESLVDVPFSLGREQVLRLLGTPDKSGGPTRIPGIGDRGAHDRFSIPEGALHIQYAVGRDEIDMITLMRTDVAP